MIVAVGKPCPFPVVEGAFSLTLNGMFQLLIGARFDARDARILQTGRLDLAFKRFEVDGKPYVYAAAHTPLRVPLAADTAIDFGKSALQPLPSEDRKTSYLCSMIAVDTPSQKVVGLRTFAFDRAIGDLLWEVYQRHHDSPPTLEQLQRASLAIRAMPEPSTLFSYPPSDSSRTYLRQRLRP